MKMMRIHISGVPYGHLCSMIMRSRQDGGHSPDKWNYNSIFQTGTTCRESIMIIIMISLCLVSGHITLVGGREL